MHCNSRTKHIRCCCRSVAMAAPERQGLDNGGYVRHPTVCNGRVAFVVEEDIWLTDCCAKGTNGPKIPKRMTNFGRAAHPLFSPSADYIAFTDSSDLWVLTVKDGRCRFAAQCSLTHGIAQCHMSPKLQAAYMVCHGCFRLQWVRCRCLQCSLESGSGNLWPAAWKTEREIAFTSTCILANLGQSRPPRALHVSR